jgi:putative hemolysin
MTGASLEIFIVFVLILGNGVFAMAEAAVVASRKARLQQAAEGGDAKARAALQLAEHPNRFLSTVQIGITLVGIFSGAFGGATLSKQISAWAQTIPTLAPYADSIGLGLVVAVITYFSLVVGELVPKRLALQNPEKIAASVAGPMNLISRVASPLVSFLSFSTDMVLRIFGVKASDEPPVTEEEIKVMVDQGTQAGVFHTKEQEIIESVFRLGDCDVRSLMTHRHDIIWLDLTQPLEENQRILATSVYSRLPVCQGGLEHVVGVVRAKDLLAQCLNSGSLDLSANLVPPVFVPITQSAFKLMETLKAKRSHMALVVDEQGTTRGIVTLNDLLEAIVGDLPAVDESDEQEAVQREDGSWLMDGTLSLREFKHLLNISELPGEDNDNFHTLSGFIMAQLGHVPTTSDHFETAGLRFEVIDMDGHRVDKILVTLVTQAGHQSQ